MNGKVLHDKLTHFLPRKQTQPAESSYQLLCYSTPCRIRLKQLLNSQVPFLNWMKETVNCYAIQWMQRYRNRIFFWNLEHLLLLSIRYTTLHHLLSLSAPMSHLSLTIIFMQFGMIWINYTNKQTQTKKQSKQSQVHKQFIIWYSDGIACSRKFKMRC